MRTIDEYMRLPYPMELIPDTDEGGFVVSFPDLKGCLTMGKTAAEAIANAEDAKREWFASALEENMAIPEPILEEEPVQHHTSQVFSNALCSRIHRG